MTKYCAKIWLRWDDLPTAVGGPDAVPPKRAIVSTDDVHAMVSRIELAASRIIQ